ncbi:MAG: hypothetical protein GY847_33670 [Proteobacteria bacterium]|nr:hypothetical protein [Pseudomonadota bacterium]
MEAWLAFRQDLDSMAHSGAHPGLLDQWFGSMPVFLARDAARLATEPQVVLAAATRLAAVGGKTNRQIIAGLEEAYRDRDFGMQLRALSILAGDWEVKRQVVESLKSDWLRRRLSAAIILAQAQEEKGYVFLRRLLQEGKDGSDVAARVLGRFGKESEDNYLARAIRRDPGNRALAAARGELTMRKQFPHHHQMFLRRNPSSSLLSSRDGLYDIWLTAIGNVIHLGAQTSLEVIEALEQLVRYPFRGDPPQGGDKEAQRRRYQALVDFWRNVDQQISGTPMRPTWPTDFAEAMQTISRKSKVRGDTSSVFAGRVAAEIAVCSTVGNKIGYSHLAAPTSGLRILTPRGGRAADGNIATAWHAAKGDTLTFEHSDDSRIETLWIMSACRPGSKAEITSLEILGSGVGKTWTQVVELSLKTRYYQKVSLKGRIARKIGIRVLDTRRSESICISEIRTKSR